MESTTKLKILFWCTIKFGNIDYGYNDNTYNDNTYNDNTYNEFTNKTDNFRQSIAFCYYKLPLNFEKLYNNNDSTIMI